MSNRPDITKASGLLRASAEQIRLRGWTRDSFGDDLDKPDTCRVCAIGALRAAMGGDPFESRIGDPVFNEARNFLRRTIGSTSVVSWNDDYGRTEADVLNVFAIAADLAERAEVSS